jgi:hypothetical protein
MSAFNNPTNQALPIPGTNNRHTEETKTRNWLTYWQNYLNNFFSNANRLTGGTGFDNDNLSNGCITSRNLNLNIQDFMGVGTINHNGIPNTQPPFSNPANFIDAMPVLNNYSNARVEVDGWFNFYIDNAQSCVILILLQRATNVTFTSNLVTIPANILSDSLGFYQGGKRQDNVSFQSQGNLYFKFLDKGTKLANQQYFYRLQYKLNNNTQNSYVYFDACTATIKCF